tara:strand:+ start:5729 stop:5968 length:240 start_codon:yes stop_codon:yes gene_type:complete
MSEENFLPEPTEEMLAEHNLEALRQLRQRYLQDTDWTQMPDSPLSEEKKTEWQTYRQALRDITITATSCSDVVWPDTPS